HFPFMRPPPPTSTLFPYTTLFRSRPSLGAWPEGEGTRFRVWAPAANTLEVIPKNAAEDKAAYPLAKQADGSFSGLIHGIRTGDRDRKSTRLNSSHDQISYAVFCLK